MRKVSVLIAILVITGCNKESEKIADKVSEPVPAAVKVDEGAKGTKLEALSESTGEMLVRHFSHEGTIEGKGRSLVKLEVRRIADRAGVELARGYFVQVKADGIEQGAFVDELEIPFLVAAIDEMLAKDYRNPSFDNFLVKYVTKGGLNISEFSSAGGAVEATVGIGYNSGLAAYISMETLSSLETSWQQVSKGISLCDASNR